MPERDVDAIRAQCTRFVNRHYPKTPRQVLAELADFTPDDADQDTYGKGKFISDFEAELAALLGKPAAVFMPSGTMAQQIVLRIWADRTGNRSVAFHPTCHLEVAEEQGYRLLHGLNGVLVGSEFQLMTLDSLQAVRQPFGTLLLELPQHFIGGALPAWDDLTAMIAWAREKGVITHLDGARLWECQPFYARSYADIAGLFDTVYVSFYKVLDGITGSLLAGPEDVIAEARIWQRRHGGNLIHLYPYILSAKLGMAKHLPRMGEYHAKALEIAAALSAVPGIEITPNPPPTNMMRVFLRGDKDRLWNAALDIAEDSHVWVVNGLSPSSIPAYAMLPLVVGDATLDMPTDEIARLFADVLARAEGEKV